MPLGETSSVKADKTAVKPADQQRVKSDPAYREAYLDIRLNRKGGLSSGEITDNMIKTRASEIQKGKTRNYG